MAILPLESDITAKGMDQKTLHTLLTNIITAINELVDDHATNKVSIDEAIVAITELITDHATFKTAVDNIETLIEELHDDAATNKTAMDNHKTTLADYKAIYDVHVHTADGNAARTSVPDSGSPVGSPSAASAFTNTVGTAAATLATAKPASAPATLAAGVPTASAATLTNITDLTLAKG